MFVFLPLAAALVCVPMAVAFPCCFLASRRFMSVCLRGCLSLFSCWFISVPPVRGSTYFSLPAAKKSRQKKAALHRQLLNGSPGLEDAVAHLESVFPHTPRW